MLRGWRLRQRLRVSRAEVLAMLTPVEPDRGAKLPRGWARDQPRRAAEASRLRRLRRAEEDLRRFGVI